MDIATRRWSAVGPYYAMFPVDLAFEVVSQFSEVGSSVLDPFAGRASSIYAAYALGRSATGIELNPVGWLYSRAKLHPAPKDLVLRRLEQITQEAQRASYEESELMPLFFHRCYSRDVLRFLLEARRNLQWKNDPVDATLMALILVDLHGKTGSALSNQMRQGKAMAPDYSVRWWEEKGFVPPDLNPCDFMTKKVEWRYRHGSPKFFRNAVHYGDSRSLLPKLRRYQPNKHKLLFTSPPYYSITNYFYDQWLRLWMLGGTSRPSYSYGGQKRKKYDSKTEYKQLLNHVFGWCKGLLTPDATLYVRTDARAFTRETTLEVLQKHYPNKQLRVDEKPTAKASQTALYGDKSSKPGEVDIILTP